MSTGEVRRGKTDAGRVVVLAAGRAGLVLVCAAPGCGRVFGPDPAAFAAGQLSCPGCGGWTFSARLAGPVGGGSW